MDYDNLTASFSRTSQYEAAGTAWMVDQISLDIDDVFASQLEGAMGVWTEDAYLLPSNHPPTRRLSFDAPLPVRVVDIKVAQRREAGKSGVCVTEPLTMLGGRAPVIARYSAMGEALQQSKHDRVWCLFNAALSVPLMMREPLDGDACHLAALTFSESLFASSAASGAESFWGFAEKARRLTGVRDSLARQESLPKLQAAIKGYGLTFKGEPISYANTTALKGSARFRSG